MGKIVTVLGARPQFIKGSVVSRAIAQIGDLQEVVVHTGQHFDANMSGVFFEELGMPEPTHNLGVNGGRHGEMTGRMLAALEEVLIMERADAVLVYGDTNSTLAAALAAVKLQIPVAHVEAGLRSYNLGMPEEVNRIVTDRVSRWLFTPTQAAAENLQREGVDQDRIIPVGDVMYDVALHHGARVQARMGLLAELGLPPGGYTLATVHRAENTDDTSRLSAIVDGLERTAAWQPVVWPVHPRTRRALEELLAGTRLPASIRLLDPVGYLEMVQLEKYASVIATDSGGIQKEAFFHRVPCVTLRDETEWVELLEAGWNRLASPEKGGEAIDRAIREAAERRGKEVSPYGSGDAAVRIAQHLAQAL